MRELDAAGDGVTERKQRGGEHLEGTTLKIQGLGF